MSNPNPSPETRWKPGQSGNPNGRPKGVDAAFEAAFLELQRGDKTALAAWAKDNLTDFYKLYARKLTTSSDNVNRNISESVTEEQARLMAEEYIAATRDKVGERQPDRVHSGDAAGLQAGESTPQDRGPA